MARVRLDEMDKALLNLLQAEIPLTREPFRDLAGALSLNEQEVISRVGRLQGNRIIRSIGPILDSRRLGYQSTLVAMQVPEDRLDGAAAVVSEHPGVSHNYARDDKFNLWFTLSVPGSGDLESELKVLAEQVHPEAVLNLPAVRLFKIGVFFDMTGKGRPAAGHGPAEDGGPAQLTSREGAVLAELQGDFPVTARPYDAKAWRVGLDVDEFLSLCRSLRDRGIIRRFGASVNHYEAGIAANAMLCWKVPDSSVEAVGRTMAGFPEVSHCYQRKTSGNWPYNLFTMVHATTRGACEETAERIALATGIREYRVLYTVKEFKKERIRYQTEVENRPGAQYYPAFLDLKARRCVVVGGGEVALRKAKSLWEHGALVEVMSPELCSELRELADKGMVRAVGRKYRAGDVEGAFLVVAATDDRDTNQRVAEEAMSRGVLVNVVDVPELSSFIVPSSFRRGDVEVAVSTGGKSPALARRIRMALEETLGNEYGLLASLVGEVRSQMRRDNVVAGKEAWQRSLDLDALLELLRLGQRDQAKTRLLDALKGNDYSGEG